MKSVAFDGAKNKIRQNPAIIFGYNDTRGVQNAFKSMLSIFSEAASFGLGNEIQIYLFKDGSIGMKLCADTDIRPDRIDSAFIEWKKGLINFVIDTDNYNGFVYNSHIGAASTKKPYYDSIYNFPRFICNQYVTEYMTVRNEMRGAEQEKEIRSEYGEPIEGLSEFDGNLLGKYIHFSYDPEVFTETEISREFAVNCIKEAALLNTGIKYILSEQLSEENDDFKEEAFFYESITAFINGSLQGDFFIPVFECQRELEGKDKATSKHDYSVCLRIAIGFTDNSPSLNCYFNQHKLEDGGKFVDEFFMNLMKIISYIADKNQRLFNDRPIKIRELKKYVTAFFDIRTTNCIPDWANGERTALNNRMITDLVNDISYKEFRRFMEENEEKLLGLIDIIKNGKKEKKI